MRPLLIGEAPARTTPANWPPFYGRERSGRMLWELGFRVSRGPDRPGNVDAINLLDEWPGRKWPAQKAYEAARELFVPGSPVWHREHVLLVGRNVGRAFGCLESWDWFEWFYLRDQDEQLDGTRFAMIPHPSGLNRWWNSEQNRTRARTWCVGLLSRTSPQIIRGFRMPRRPTP